MKYIGDFAPSGVVRVFFNTKNVSAVPTTLAGSPAISVYKDGGVTESTSGVTLTVDFDGRTGLHLVEIDTNSDGTFYSSGSDFEVVITSGTVNAVSVVGDSVGKFSINNRSIRADVIKVSGDTTAADNLETMLDGTGGQVLSLKRLVVYNDGTGTAVDIRATDSPGIKVRADTGDVIVSTATSNGHGLKLAGQGTGVGLYLDSVDVTGATILGGDLSIVGDVTFGGGLILQDMSILGTAAASNPVQIDISGSVNDVTNLVDANLVSVSGDNGAADNLETMLDGTGGGTLSLGRMVISNSDSESSAVQIEALGASSVGLNVQGTAIGINTSATNAGYGLQAAGAGTFSINAPDGIHGDIDGDLTGSVDSVQNGIPTGIGNGAFAITVTVTDGSDPIPNALVRVTQGVDTFVGATDASGNLDFSLDAATYTVSITKGGYSFTPTTRTVTGNQAGTLTQDLEMTQVAPIAAPSDPSLCRISGYLRDQRTNKVLKGITVTAKRVNTGMTYSGGFLVGIDKTAVTDADGLFQLDVPQSDEMDPPSNWRIVCREAGIDTVQTLNGTTFDLSSIV